MPIPGGGANGSPKKTWVSCWLWMRGAAPRLLMTVRQHRGRVARMTSASPVERPQVAISLFSCL